MNEDVYSQTLAADGYQMGTNACLDKCWADFQACLQNSTFPEQCIAQLQTCQRNCAQSGGTDGGPIPL